MRSDLFDTSHPEKARSTMVSGLHESSDAEARFRRHVHPLAGAHDQLGHDPGEWHQRVDSAPVPVVTTTESGTVTWVNRAACKLFNTGSAQIAGKPLAVFVEGDDQADFDAIRAGALRATGPLTGRKFSVTPRKRRPLSVLAAVASGGTASGERELCWALTDVSALDRAEKALERTVVKLERVVREQSRRLETAVGRLADSEAERERQSDRLAGRQALAEFTAAVTAEAILTVDARGHVTTWNKAATRLFGHPAREAVGMTVGQLLDATSITELSEAAAATGTGAPVWTPALARHRDGTTWKAEIGVRDASSGDAVLYACAVRRERR